MPPVAALIGPIIEGISAAGAGIAAGATGIAEGIGIPAMLAGPLGTGVEWGIGEGALSAGEAAIEGKDPLKGFESGALSGFIGGAGGPLLETVVPGLSPMLASTAANAAGGAAGAAATGGSPGLGAIEGGATGLLASSLHPGIGAPTGGGSAVGTAAPPSVALDPAASGILPGGAGSVGDPTAGLPGSVGAGAAAGSAGSLPGDINVSATGSAPSPVTSGVTVGTNPSGDLSGQSLGGTLASGASGSTSGSGGASSFLGMLEKNPTLALTGVGLLGDLIKGNQMAPAEKQLQASANRLGAQGQIDEGYLRSGTLPPGEQAALEAQGQAAKAAINSMYAGRGTPGSSANVEDIANEGIRQQATAGQLAMELYKTGVEETGMSNQILLDLLNVQLSQDSDLSNAIAKMSSSLAGMGAPIQPGAS